MNTLNSSKNLAARTHTSHFTALFLLAGCLAAAAQGTALDTVVTDTGSLNSSRESHTATLLPNGQVLVAGGEAVEYGLEDGLAGAPQIIVYKSAELYDPVAGAWTYTGNLNSSRESHTATLLPNGKVLVAGGGDIRAELYNPVTGVWTYTGSLGTARASHTATLLANGKVLVAGGASGNDISLASAELYDPATGHLDLHRQPRHRARTLTPPHCWLTARCSSREVRAATTSV